MVRLKWKVNYGCSRYLYFFATGLAVCSAFAVYRILLHFWTLHSYSVFDEPDPAKYISKCGCLQMAMQKLGFDELIDSLDGQQHYEKYEYGKPLREIVPDYCVELIDDYDKTNTTAMMKMDKRCYREVMSSPTRRAFAKEAFELMEHLQNIGVWVAMSQGTALGSQRAHGFLPWDDDLDFMVLYSDRDKIEKKLVEVGKKRGISFKIDKSDSIGRYKVKCGYWKKYCGMIIDLWYVTLYPTYLSHYSRWMPIADILPLRMRPYEGYWFPGPAKMDNYLKRAYDEDYFGQCVFHNHQYSSMKPTNCPNLPCAKLKWRREFPHVEFCHLPNGWTFEMNIVEREVQAVFLYRTSTT